MITMIHANPARLDERGTLLVDRKFHDGMLEYQKHLRMPIVSVHPLASAAAEQRTMDLVAVPKNDLGYGVLTLETLKSGYFVAAGQKTLDETIGKSRLVYGDGRGANEIAARRKIPLVAVCEYNLRTEVVFAGADAKNTLVRVVRKVRAAKRYFREIATAMRQAVIVHCNGYPVYHEAGWFSSERLLYLDSRMRTSGIVPSATLEQRLATFGRRRARLLFSGRIEIAKGALHLAEVAAACRDRGLDFELVIYGAGSQERAVRAAVARLGLQDRVTLHEPVPFPELVELARSFDLFVCCHVQDDPSCTYLESLGCGLPIAGYANAMWRSMCEESRAGVATKLGAPAALADAIVALLRNADEFKAHSRRARSFALEHAFELEFVRRTDSINELWEAGAGRAAR